MANPLLNGMIAAMGTPIQGQSANQMTLDQFINQVKSKGLTPDMAFQKLMQNPQIAQRVNAVMQKYPNMTISQIAQQNGIDISKFHY